MEVRKPSILIPFTPSDEDSHTRDVFVYLRPETNGVEVESVIMNAIKKESDCKELVKLVYLANLPGNFITQKGLIEHHYRMRLLFAMNGKRMFTKHMKKVFSSYFRYPFDKAEIIGAYEALKRLGLSEEQLFNSWVSPSDMLNINGQSIKRIS
ncbi:MAG: hypothetical protein PQJ46_05160, partial [Spirochaetales bacterium]|nr:hypothetical protein [Spirochaetales bacterium]